MSVPPPPVLQWYTHKNDAEEMRLQGQVKKSLTVRCRVRLRRAKHKVITQQTAVKTSHLSTAVFLFCLASCFFNKFLKKA